uniref:Uncharacterized protein n=1 Tax=Clastoptera arizonana TaxID=38151 RepID=A0A1B6EG43_9HEMI
MISRFSIILMLPLATLILGQNEGTCGTKYVNTEEGVIYEKFTDVDYCFWAFPEDKYYFDITAQRLRVTKEYGNLYNATVITTWLGGYKTVIHVTNIYLGNGIVYEIPQDKYGYDTLPSHQAQIFATSRFASEKYNYVAYYSCINNNDHSEGRNIKDSRFLAVDCSYTMTLEDLDYVSLKDCEQNFNGSYILVYPYLSKSCGYELGCDNSQYEPYCDSGLNQEYYDYEQIC